MRDKKRPTVTDVATVAGVGASTVSRYVRHAKSISPRMRERIEEAITKLGYEPNILARGLRVGHTRVIGVLVPHVTNIFYAAAVRAIEDEARDRGFTVLLLTHHENHRSQERQLNVLRQFQCDGIVLIPASGTSVDRIKELIGTMPLVALDRALGKEWDSITLHNYAAGKEATKHLLGHGHKRIVAVTAPHQLDTLERRLKGYTEAVQNAGLTPEVVLWQSSDQLRTALTSSLKRTRAPATAILTLSYSITVNVLHALRACDISLRTKALVAIDDLEFATLVDPPLTTLIQPAEKLGSLAIDRLFERMDGTENAVSHRRIDGTLVTRGSCGCKVHSLESSFFPLI